MEENKPVRKTSQVEFVLNMPQARAVSVAGTFNGWDAKQAPLRRAPDGTWRARMGLPPGRHEYRFVVDGQWQDDPRARTKVPNPFGGENAVIIV